MSIINENCDHVDEQVGLHEDVLMDDGEQDDPNDTLPNMIKMILTIKDISCLFSEWALPGSILPYSFYNENEIVALVVTNNKIFIFNVVKMNIYITTTCTIVLTYHLSHHAVVDVYSIYLRIFERLDVIVNDLIAIKIKRACLLNDIIEAQSNLYGGYMLLNILKTVVSGPASPIHPFHGDHHLDQSSQHSQEHGSHDCNKHTQKCAVRCMKIDKTILLSFIKQQKRHKAHTVGIEIMDRDVHVYTYKLIKGQISAIKTRSTLAVSYNEENIRGGGSILLAVGK
ncbi:hypothetical protein ACJX0J_042187 [Zea mays]